MHLFLCHLVVKLGTGENFGVGGFYQNFAWGLVSRGSTRSTTLVQYRCIILTSPR